MLDSRFKTKYLTADDTERCMQEIISFLQNNYNKENGTTLFAATAIASTSSKTNVHLEMGDNLWRLT